MASFLLSAFVLVIFLVTSSLSSVLLEGKAVGTQGELLQDFQEEEEYPRHVVSVLTANNGAPWGEWRRAHFCPQRTYAAAVELKSQAPVGALGDNTALNGIKFHCIPRNPEPEKYYGTAESYRGEWGDWREPLLCYMDSFITRFILRVDPPGFLADEVAACNVNFYCRNFDTDTNAQTLYGNGEFWGDWGMWSFDCPLGSAICGLQVKSQTPSVLGDTALNDVKMFCCDD